MGEKRVDKRVARFGAGDRQLVIEDPETLKVLYDPLRLKLIGRLRDGRTAKQLAEELDRPLTSLYYHLNLLVEHGLAKVDEERISGRTVERVFRRTADEFVAHGEVAKVVDGLIDRDASLASRVAHIQRIHRGPSRPDVFNMIQDLTFTATQAEAGRLIEAIRHLVESEVPKGGRTKPGGRRFRFLLVFGETEDQPGESSRRPRRP